ncbi:MAG: hypothetical protein JW927_16195 [Deltaproteobacteria bacterium]|nr:hypothetical protein [Deltaproteobacteria bacterium]
MLDISRIAASANVFGKWVAKKMPVVTGIELAINQLYNAIVLVPELQESRRGQ